MQRKHSKEEYRPGCTVSNTKFSSVTLSELAMDSVISSFNKAVNKKNRLFETGRSGTPSFFECFNCS